MVRTSLVLALVASALLGFILFFERGTVSQGEREKRKGMVLERFVRERVSRVEIQRKGATTTLFRGPDKETGFDLGSWQVLQPFASKADGPAVDSLLGALEWINARRTLSDVSDQDIVRFGLDKPRYRVAFTVGRERSSFSIGGESPDSGGAYMRTEDPKTVYVIGKDVVEALDNEPAHFHTKDLHEGVSIYALQRATLSDSSGERVIEKRGDYFWLTKPQLVLASEPMLTEAVNAIDALRATRFVSDDKKALATYGLDAPRFEAKLELRTYDVTNKSNSKPIDKQLTLRIGKACAGQHGESYVSVDAGPIMCALDADLAKIEKTGDELRDARLLVIADAQVHGVRIRSGKAELVLTDAETGWTYKLLQDGKTRSVGDVDSAALADWFRLLHSASAESFMPAGAAPLREAGSGAVTHVVSFERGKDKPAYEIRFGRHEAERVAATRLEGEPFTLWFPQRALDLVSVSTARFRKARLLNENEGAFSKLQVVRAGGVTETVTKDANGYTLVAPAAIDVERSAVDEIVRLLSELEVLRFVADAPEPEHGLAKPALTLRLEYGAAKQHTLKLGADTDGGRYAQLDADPAVFVVPAEIVAVLDEPLASRAGLATPLETLSKLRIEHGAILVSSERVGDVWAIVGTGAGAEPQSKRAEALASAVATLRATRVTGYGAAAANQGMQQPSARITVTSLDKGGAAHSHELLFGGAVGEGARADVYARRSDLDVGFVVSRDALDALLEVPAPAPSPQ